MKLCIPNVILNECQTDFFVNIHSNNFQHYIKNCVNESKLQNYANLWPFLTWQPQIPLTCFASSARARELTNGHFSANLEHAAI